MLFSQEERLSGCVSLLWELLWRRGLGKGEGRDGRDYWSFPGEKRVEGYVCWGGAMERGDEGWMRGLWGKVVWKYDLELGVPGCGWEEGIVGLG